MKCYSEQNKASREMERSEDKRQLNIGPIDITGLEKLLHSGPWFFSKVSYYGSEASWLPYMACRQANCRSLPETPRLTNCHEPHRVYDSDLAALGS